MKTFLICILAMLGVSAAWADMNSGSISGGGGTTYTNTGGAVGVIVGSGIGTNQNTPTLTNTVNALAAAQIPAGIVTNGADAKLNSLVITNNSTLAGQTSLSNVLFERIGVATITHSVTNHVSVTQNKNSWTSSDGAFLNARVGDSFTVGNNYQYWIFNIVNSTNVLTAQASYDTCVNTNILSYEPAAKELDDSAPRPVGFVSGDGSIGIMGGNNSGGYYAYNEKGQSALLRMESDGTVNLFCYLTNATQTPNIIKIDPQNGNNYEAFRIWPNGGVSTKWGFTNFAFSSLNGGVAVTGSLTLNNATVLTNNSAATNLAGLGNLAYSNSINSGNITDIATVTNQFLTTNKVGTAALSNATAFASSGVTNLTAGQLATIAAALTNGTVYQPAANTLSNLANQASTPLNLAGGTNLPAASVVGTVATATLASYVNGTLSNSISGNAATATTATNSPAGLPLLDTSSKTNLSIYGTLTANAYSTQNGTNFGINSSGNGLFGGGLAATNNSLYFPNSVTINNNAGSGTIAFTGGNIPNITLKQSTGRTLTVQANGIGATANVYGDAGTTLGTGNTVELTIVTNFVKSTGAMIATNGYILPNRSSAPSFAQIGSATNMIFMWSSNDIPPTVRGSYYDSTTNLQTKWTQ